MTKTKESKITFHVAKNIRKVTEYDLKRNKERLENNAQGEIKDNIETDAALADARETAIRKNVLNVEFQ